MLQKEALDVLKLGKNVFLTGAAGSGKTYVLNQYIRYLKKNGIRPAITASTGIAATHLEGMTIHSWSGIGIKDSLSDKDLEKLIKIPRIRQHFEKSNVLIIDEISMLHPHQLDMVDMIAKKILKNDQPFGDMQVILCGDFFQLPPVSSGSASSDTPFAYESIAWQEGNFHVCYLQEQHRQSDDPLLDILNDIRNGTAGEHTKVPLRKRYKKEPEGDIKATRLYCRNINVDTINEKELRDLDDDVKLFKMSTKGNSSTVEILKKSCLAPDQLRLKVGAEVMFIKNDSDGNYVNGTRGIVTGFDKKTNNWPIVKTYSGKTITANPVEWKFEDNGKIRAVLTQVPLRLAWAITIHKSQGMTLDAVEVDLGDAFEPGMGYVALSRVRKLDGLKLMNLNEMALTINAKIREHDWSFKSDSAKTVVWLNDLDNDEMTEMQEDTLSRRFKSGKIRKTNQKGKQYASMG